MTKTRWTPNALLQLETERFIISSMLREDVTEEFTDWLSDPDVMMGLNMHRKRLTRPQAVRFVISCDNHSRFCLAVKDKANGQLIGLFIVNCDLNQQIAETSVVIGNKDYWGKDVVKEARFVLLDFLFDQMNMFKVIGRPHGRNFSSIYNYKALGFTCEAVLRQQMKAINSEQRLDQLIFGILKDEWLQKREELLNE